MLYFHDLLTARVRDPVQVNENQEPNIPAEPQLSSIDLSSTARADPSKATKISAGKFSFDQK